MRQQPTNETAGLRQVDEGQPPYLYPDYVATRLRAPKKPLIILPKPLSNTTGPAYGRGPIGGLDNDLTCQHEGEPLGERIIVTGRVLDGDGRPVRNSLIEIWQANPAGRYIHENDRHPAPLDPNFSGAGRCLVSVFARGLLKRLVTRVSYDLTASFSGHDPHGMVHTYGLHKGPD